MLLNLIEAMKTKQTRKLTISQASRLLPAGYSLGRGRTDLLKGQTYYQVATPLGSIVEMTARQIAKLIQAGRGEGR